MANKKKERNNLTFISYSIINELVNDAYFLIISLK